MMARRLFPNSASGPRKAGPPESPKQPSPCPPNAHPASNACRRVEETRCTLDFPWLYPPFPAACPFRSIMAHRGLPPHRTTPCRFLAYNFHEGSRFWGILRSVYGVSDVNDVTELAIGRIRPRRRIEYNVLLGSK